MATGWRNDAAFILWFPGPLLSPSPVIPGNTRFWFLTFLGRHLAWDFCPGDYHRPINRATDWPCLTYSRP